MARGASTRELEHVLRRAGFGARPDELDLYGGMSRRSVVETLLNYEEVADSVDSFIGQPGYAGMTIAGMFLPSSNIIHARQRWLFRMVHSDRPLQEKMTLFWHHHFATAYSKIAGIYGATEATRYLAAKPSEDPGQVRGQIEMLRDNALGNFRDILVNIAKDTAMLIWLDGRTNTKAKPQENFGREIMELFTMGVGHYTEPDVYAAARVFSGWNLQPTGTPGNGSLHYDFFYNAGQHETSAKTFSFPIYSNGSHTIAARAASDGMQDGIDLINALAGNPNTGRYLAGKLWRFFVSEFQSPDPAFVDRVASVYLSSGFDMKAVMREVLLSSEFWDPRAHFARYSWPVEFVVRALKEIGWRGFSVNDALVPMANMGMTLYEPPDVSGWRTGQEWFSTGAMLSRMNFAAQLSNNQKVNLLASARPHGRTAETLLAYFLGQLAPAPYDSTIVDEFSSYLYATGHWTGSDAQIQAKSAGLVHLIAGSPEYHLQ
jgi:uncharacterized protein (DUF1800 family)